MNSIFLYEKGLRQKMTKARYTKAWQNAETVAKRRLAENYGVRSWKSFKEESGWKYGADCLLRHILEGDLKAKGLVADWLSYHPVQTILHLDEREYDL